MRKPAPPREIPPPLELDCLRVLWRLGEGNVKQVRDTLAPDRRLAYTTVMTLLDRLFRRDRINRRKVGRAFVYSPIATRNELRRVAVKELVNTFFEGSPDALSAYLSQEPETSDPSPATPPEPALDTTLL